MNLMFEKWENGKWYIVLPEYDGDQEDLEMIDGADKLLDYLTPDNLYVSIDCTLDDRLDYPLVLELISHDLIGATYQVKGLSDFNGTIWLCNVVHFLFGEHPEFIRFKRNAKGEVY